MTVEARLIWLERASACWEACRADFQNFSIALGGGRQLLTKAHRTPTPVGRAATAL